MYLLYFICIVTVCFWLSVTCNHVLSSVLFTFCLYITWIFRLGYNPYIFFCFLKTADHTVLPPAYPPPPVPQGGKTSYSEARARLVSGKGSVPVLPLPPPKKSLPDLKPEAVLCMRGDLPFQYHAECPLRPQLTRQQTGSLAPPVPLARKPTCLVQTGSPLPVRLPITQTSATSEDSEKPKVIKLPAKGPPPLPSSKPRLTHSPVTPANPQPPRESDKPVLLTPKTLSKSQGSTEKPLVPLSKPEKPSPPQ